MTTSLPNSPGRSRRRFLSLSAFAACATVAGAKEPLALLPSVEEEVQRMLAAAPLRMMFRGSTAQELAEWQAQFAAKLRELIGPHRPPAKWTPKSLSSTTLADHTREEWLLEGEDDGMTR